MTHTTATEIPIAQDSLQGRTEAAEVEAARRHSFITSFKISAGNSSISLVWEGGDILGIERFFLERSEDNTVYTVITEFNGQRDDAYEFVDGTVRNGVAYYYRLVSRDKLGVVTFHNILSAVPGADEGNMSLGR